MKKKFRKVSMTLYLLTVLGYLLGWDNNLTIVNAETLPKQGDTYEYAYTGNYQTFTAPVKGIYTFELWGAQGGSHNGGTGGKGAYTKGSIELNKGETVYIYVGAQGGSSTTAGSFNGGGAKTGSWVSGKGAAGGGATDVRLVSGNWNDATGLASRIMVAAGGGGSEGYNGAPGGALTGYTWYSGSLTTTGAANQVNGGTGKYGGGTFGKGNSNAYTAGTGGGYYGGSTPTFSLTYNSNVAPENSTASFTGIKHVRYGMNNKYKYGYYNKSVACSNSVFGDPISGTVKACYVTSNEIYAGGSGSSYISGHNGSIAIKSATDTTAKVTTATSIADSYHYSGKIFTNTQMIAGNASMPSPTGSNVTGRAGNGYAKVTLTKITSTDATLKSLTLNNGDIAIDFNRDTTEYVINLTEDQTKVTIDAVQNDSDAVIADGSLGSFEIMPNGHTQSITVTAPSGDVKTYTLYFVRPASSYQYLKDIQYNGISIANFNPTTMSYEVNLPYYFSDNIELSVIKGRPGQQVVGIGSFIIDKTMTSLISVTSEDGNQSTTYMINFIMEDSSLLKTLNIGNVPLMPIFKSETFNYKISLNENPESYKIEAIPYDKDAKVTITGSLVSKDNYLTITVTEPTAGTSVYTVKTTGGTEVEYTQNSCSTWTVPVSGTYRLQVWGAEGGGSRLSGNAESGIGGKGGYSAGNITLAKGTVLYLCTGGAGTSTITGVAQGGFNGGGSSYGTGTTEPGNGGGGATDIRIGANTLFNRVIVAGGGGGGGEDAGDAYGHGGGLQGANGTAIPSYNATQTEAGLNGQFGIGASTGVGDGGAGGGGWYGGGTISSTISGTDTSGGGGGSGFVYTEDAIVPEGYAVDKKYYLTDAVTIAGNQSMPTHDNESTMIGNLGNGYIKIDLLYVSSNDTRLSSLTVSPKNIEEVFDKDTHTYNVILSSEQHEVDIQATPFNQYAEVVDTTIGKIEVEAGNSTHEIMVMAEDGSIGIYTIQFYRAKSDYKYLKDIKVDGKSIENFDPMQPNYTIELPYDYDKTIEIEGIPARLSQTVLNNGNIDIAKQNYEHMIGVISEDETKSFAYNLTFHTADSSKLKNLLAGENGEYGIENFNSEQYEYTIEVPKNVISLPIQTVAYDKDATVKVTGNGYIKSDGTVITVTVTEPNVEPTVYKINVKRNTSSEGKDFETQTYNCTNGVQEFTAPYTAEYQIELWGAQGGSHNGGTGGKGAYTKGTILLQKGETIYIYVGCQGGNSTTTKPFNGGGAKTGNWVSGYGAAGGGATDIRIDNTLAGRIMVAAGGGGSEGYDGAPGGALTGYTWYNGTLTTTGAANQINGGTGKYGGGAFGLGNSNAYTAGTGGGYYGGSTPTFSLNYNSNVAAEGATAKFTGIKHVRYGMNGRFAYGYKSNSVACTNGVFGDPNQGTVKACYVSTTENYAGGSGSSYISGYNGSIAIKSASDTTPKVTVATSIEDSYHYSGKVFKDTQMIAGNASMPNPNGGSMTGNTGNGKAVITMLYEPSEDNTLSHLIVSKGTLDPVFDRETGETEFTLDLSEVEGLENDLQVMVTGSASDALATVEGNGMHALDKPVTDIVITVTAESGAKKDYTIHVKRKVSHESNLKDIEIAGMIPSICALGEEGQYCNYNGLIVNEKQVEVTLEDGTTETRTEYEYIYDYDITVPIKIKEITFNPILAHEAQTITGAGTQTLNVGLNTFHINVTAEDEETKSIYTFNVTREPGGYSYLDNLQVLTPTGIDLGFDPDVLDYRITVPYSQDYVVLDYVPCDETVTVEIANDKNLVAGETNDVTVTVKALNGSRTTYHVYVYRETKENTYLFNLDIYDTSVNSTNDDPLTLTPNFRKDIFNYSLTVGSEVTDIYVDALSDDYDATVIGTGDYTLKAGSNVIEVTVTYEDGATVVYTVNINRARSDNAYLKELALANGTLSEPFNKEQFQYTVYVDNDIKALEYLRITPEVATSTYRVIGGKNLKTGTNTVRILVTSESRKQNTYTLTVIKKGSSNNNLLSLSTDTGAWVETFHPDRLQYHVTVPYDTSKIIVTAVAEDNNAKISGDGIYALAIGENDIYVDVTSEGGDVKQYHIIVTREPNGNNYLLDINLNIPYPFEEGTFNKLTNSYTVNVPNDVKEVTILGIPESPTATVEGNGTYELKTGNNEIKLVVTAQNYEEKEYIVNFVREASENSNLELLVVEEGSLKPEFDQAIDNYRVVVNNTVDTVHVRVTPEDENATYELVADGLTVNGDVVSGLIVGENTIRVRIIAEKGEPYVTEYTLVVKRQTPGNGFELESITLSSGTLQPTFDPYQYIYDAAVPFETDSVYIEAIAKEIGNAYISGTCFSETVIDRNSGACNLQVGTNVIVINSLSDKNKIEQTYQIVVVREKSSDASLSNVLLDNGILSPGFDKDVLEYTTTIHDSKLLFQTIETVESEATYEVINNEKLSIGNNDVTIRVTAPDGKTTKDYTIHVNKNDSNNNNLKSLDVGGYPYTPTFDKDKTVYEMEVERDVNSVAIEAIAEDENAVVAIEGGFLQNLNVGKNIIDIVVTSESGNDKVYRVIVTRKGSDDNLLKELTVSDGTLDPVFGPNVNVYDVNVSHDVDFITISGVLSDANATVTGFGTYELTELITTVNVEVTSESGAVNTYTVNIHKESIKSAKLKNVVLDHYTLSPEFHSDIDSYLVTVDNEVTSLTFKEIVKEDDEATYVINGNENFKVGMNTVTITVTSSDGAKEESYVFNVNRQMASNTYLDYIDLSHGTLVPAYNKTTMEYTVEVDKSINSIKVTGVAEDATAVVTGNDTYTLTPGWNDVSLTVTSTLGVTRTYNLHIHKEASMNNLLEGLTVRNGRDFYDLNPAFDKATNNYKLEACVDGVCTTQLTDDVSKLTITATPGEATQVISGDVGEVTVNPGDNTYTIVVTSESGEINEYVIHAYRPLSNNAYLTDIIPSVGELEPSFGYFETEYTLTVPSTTNTLAFEVYTEDSRATVTGHEEMYITEQTFTRTITVTAEDGTERQINIHVTKQQDNDATLKTLEVAGYTFTDPFESDKTTYQITVPYDKSILLQSDVTAIANDERATVTKMSSLSLSTSQVNRYIIQVLAKDGFTSKTYTIEVVREKGSDATLSNLRVNGYTLKETFDKNTFNYTVDVDKNMTILPGSEVIAVPNDSEAKVTKMDFLDLKTSQVFTIKVESADKSETNTYTITVGFGKSSDARLQSLTATTGVFSETFDKDTFEYTLDMQGTDNKVTFTAVPVDKDAQVISGLDEVTVNYLSYDHEIVVRAEDGTEKTYTIHIVRHSTTNAYLKDIVVSDVKLNKPFNEREFNYTYYVPAGTTVVTSEDITPVLADMFASFEQPERLELVEGEDWTWEIVVKSSDNSVTNTYTLTIAYWVSDNNYLSSLTSGSGTFRETFDKELSTYHLDVLDTLTSVELFPVPEEEGATVISSNVVTLDTDEVTHTIQVQALNGDIREYTVIISKKLTSEKYLENVIFGGYSRECEAGMCTLTPPFKGEDLNYSMIVPSNINQLTIEVVKRSENQQYELINGTLNTPVDERGYALMLGENTLYIDVTNSVGDKVRYTFKITKLSSSNTNLASLKIVAPFEHDFVEFDPGISEYYIDMANQYDYIDVEAVVEDLGKASVEVLDNTNLKVGKNIVTVRVTAEDGNTKDYIIHVFRENTYDNLLNSLTVTDSNGQVLPLRPSFDKGIYAYQVTVPADENAVTLDAEPRISSTTIISGLGIFDELQSVNRFEITTQAETGELATYVVTVIKDKSDNAFLSSLSAQEGSIQAVDNPAISFDKEITNYEITVNNSINSLTLDYTTEHPNAKVVVSGNANFMTGDNTVKLTVTAENGFATKEYTITVHKEPSTNILLDMIYVDQAELEGFNPNTNQYTLRVDKDKDTIDIMGVRQDTRAMLVGNGSYSLAYGENVIKLDVISESWDINSYELTIIREYDRRLSNLTIGNIDFGFDMDTYEYEVSVSKDVQTLDVFGTPNAYTSVVTGNTTYDLAGGENEIVVTVTDPNNEVTNYIVKVYKELNNDATLEKLHVLEGIIDPQYHKETDTYIVDIPYEFTSTTLHALPTDNNATVEILNNEYFKVGNNTVKIVVTAEDGVTAKEYTLTVNRQSQETYSNKLKELSVDHGTLSPTFNPDLMFYQVSVDYAVDKIKVNAVLEDSGATISINNNGYDLQEGKNIIPITVTSRGGYTRTYTIEVTRAYSNEARIKSLTFQEHSLTPFFDKDVYNYDLTLDGSILNFEPIITMMDEEATYTIQGNMNLLVGNNDVVIKTLARDGKTSATYTIHIKRLPSNNNNLASLWTSVGTWDKTFESNNAGPYIVSVDNSVNSIEVQGSVEFERATIAGLGIYQLEEKITDIEVVVTSESEMAKKYTIRVVKGDSNDALLKLLNINEGTITPTFDPKVNEYTVTLPHEVESILLTALANDEKATVVGAGTKALAVGENTFTITVTAVDGTINEYSLKVTRQASETEEFSSKLAKLVVREGILSPNFYSNVGSYAVSVPNDVAKLTLDIETEDPLATYEVVGNEDFVIGENVVNIVVTGQDDKTSLYTITVTRQISSNNRLSYLYTSYGSLEPTFDANTLYYEVQVPSTLDEITLYAKAVDSKATVTGADTYALSGGKNYFYVTVTSAVGIERTYTVMVEKALSTDNTLLDLTSDIGTWDKTFTSSEPSYTIDVPIGTESITLTATKNHPSQTVSGDGVIQLVKGENHASVEVLSESGELNTYNITINRAIDDDNEILSITPSTGTLVESTKEGFDYELTVKDSDSIINFAVETKSKLATVSGHEHISLNYGENEVTITVTAESGRENVVHISVLREKDLIDITVNPTQINMRPLETKEITSFEITFNPVDATYQELTFESMNEEIVTIENGVIKAIKPGVTTIKISSQHNPTIYKEVQVNVQTFLITSSVYDVNRDNEELLYVIGAEPKTAIPDFIDNFDNETSTLKVFDKDGNDVTETTDFVATGMTIKLIIQDTVYDELQIVVRGDINGDGKINAIDASLVEGHILMKQALEGVPFLAADINGDNLVNAIDASYIESYILVKIQTVNPKKETTE